MWKFPHPFSCNDFPFNWIFLLKCILWSKLWYCILTTLKFLCRMHSHWLKECIFCQKIIKDETNYFECFLIPECFPSQVLIWNLHFPQGPVHVLKSSAALCPCLLHSSGLHRQGLLFLFVFIHHNGSFSRREIMSY